MSFRNPAAVPRPPRLPRRPRLLLPLIVAVVVVLSALGVFTSIYTDLLWFRSTGFGSVFTGRLRTQLLLFGVFGAFLALAVAANLVLAYRLRPPFRPLSPEQQSLERYRVGIEPYLTQILVVVAVVVGLFAGTSAAGRWRTWMLWRNGQSFGQKDAQFGRDVSYYAFTYPFYRFVLGFLFVAVVLSLLAAAATHYLFGGLRLQTPGDKVSPAAQAHLAVLLGIFLLLKAVAYWLDRYGLAFSERGVVTGPSYTDVNSVLPAKTILVFVAVICAGLFFATIVFRGWLLPAVGLALMVFSAVVIGGVYPAAIQRFQVSPSAVDKEAKYITRNIEATRKAYGLGDVSFQNYPGVTTTSPEVIRQSRGTLDNVRLLDPNRIQATWQQLQGFRSFYGFPDSLDIDRYAVDGQQRDQIVAVRELNQSGLSSGQDNWINRHLVYTHGFGFVSAPGNTVDEEGRPQFSSAGIVPNGQGALAVKQPRVYFGEQSPSYSVVGAPSAASPRELDYPSSGDSQSDSGQVNNTYNGKGGVAMGSTFRKLLFAFQFREKNLLLSSGINNKSRILYIRAPRDRVQKVAPWLQLDGDPYPAVIDGRIVWILDGYTTSDGFPYSQRQTLGELTQDSTVTTSSSVAAQPKAQVNYIRNSVKATVDAYTGTVRLYEWSTDDPVLKTWMKAFPGTVQPKSKISADLQAHLRYPEDLFKVQRDLLSKYHVTDPRVFFNGTDFWRVPADPTQGNKSTDQPPYYVTLTMPGSTKPVFSLTSPLAANNKRQLASFLQANSDPGPDYGKLTVLQLPRGTQVNGPGQVANNFESNPTAAQQLTLLRGGGSDTVEGNLLTLPVAGGLLYVEPIYVQAGGGQAYPTLQRVFVNFGDAIGFAPTLDQALNQIFGANVGTGGGTGTGTGTGPPAGGGTSTGTGNAALQRAIADANRAFQDGQAALRRGDFTAYGEAQSRLQSALQRAAAAAAGVSTGGTAGGTPSPSASAAPGASPAATPTPSRPASATPSPSVSPTG